MRSHLLPRFVPALSLLAAAPAVALAGGDAFLNEIYASHSGTDDQEFIELVGTPGLSLDGYMVLVVEGDAGPAGTLDRAWDLTGLSIPADGYFLLGDDAVPGIDFSIGVSNAIENGTETFYLISTSDTSAITALLGTNLDPDGDLVTVLPGLATLEDLVGLVDSGFGTGDLVYDGATPIGPDGPFLPAGIFRGVDYPDPWCPDSFLDFDPTVNLNEMSTAGAQNVNCDSQVNTYCTAQTNSDGCDPLIVSTGTPSASSGMTFDIDASLLMKSSSAILIYSTTGTDNMPFLGGVLCLAQGTVARTPLQNTGGSGVCGGAATFDFNAYIAGGNDPALVPGQDVFVQYWSRDENASPSSNLTSALAFNIGV